MPAARKPASTPALKGVIDAARKQSPAIRSGAKGIANFVTPLFAERLFTQENLDWAWKKVTDRTPATEKVTRLQDLSDRLGEIEVMITNNRRGIYSSEQVEHWQERIGRLHAKVELAGLAQKKTQKAELKQLEAQIEKLRSEVSRAADEDNEPQPEDPKGDRRGTTKHLSRDAQPKRLQDE